MSKFNQRSASAFFSSVRFIGASVQCAQYQPIMFFVDLHPIIMHYTSLHCTTLHCHVVNRTADALISKIYVYCYTTITITHVLKYLYFSVLKLNSPWIEPSGHPAGRPQDNSYLPWYLLPSSLGPDPGLADISSADHIYWFYRDFHKFIIKKTDIWFWIFDFFLYLLCTKAFKLSAH